MYLPRLASGEVPCTGRPMQKPQLQPGVMRVRRGPCLAGQGPLREWSGTYIVRSASLLGFELPVWLWWRNALISMTRRVNKHLDAHHYRQIAGPVSIAEASNFMVCTQVMHETFNIPAVTSASSSVPPTVPTFVPRGFVSSPRQSKVGLSPIENVAVHVEPAGVDH